MIGLQCVHHFVTVRHKITVNRIKLIVGKVIEHCEQLGHSGRSVVVVVMLVVVDVVGLVTSRMRHCKTRQVN